MRSVRDSFFAPIFERKSGIAGLVIVSGFVLLIVFGRYLVPYGPYATSAEAESPPSLAHLLGTDYQGKDILSELLWGAIPSVSIGVASSLGAVLIGLVVGSLAGYFQRLEGLLTGMTDVMIMFPAVPLIVLIGAIRYPSTIEFAALLALILWPPIARSIRSQVLSVREMPFIEVARVSGMSDFEILSKLIVRSVASLSFAYFVLTAAAGIVLVTGLEYVGVGNPDVVSWGSMVYWAQQFGFYAGAWWWIIAPGIAISLLTTGFALIGFSMEETFNPRLRSSS